MNLDMPGCVELDIDVCLTDPHHSVRRRGDSCRGERSGVAAISIATFDPDELLRKWLNLPPIHPPA